MKTKLLLGTLLLLISVDMCLAHTKRRYKYLSNYKYVKSHKERSIFLPAANADRVDNTLILSFQFSLEAADITIDDKEGAVVYQQHFDIVDGNTVSIEINDDTSFPLSVKIESPTFLIEGEIIEE